MSRGFSCIGLDNPKTPANVGSAMRAAGCYDARFVAMTGRRIPPGRTDTMKQYRHRPLLRVDDLEEVIPFDCVPVAVELVDGAESLVEYKHPASAFYIFGAEDSTLGERVLSWCRDVVAIPTSGCMNLAATVNVVMYDRMMKRLKGGV